MRRVRWAKVQLMKWPYISVVFWVIVLGATITLADDHEQARQLRMQGDILPLEEVLQQLPHMQDARIIEVELEREHGRYVYEIERLEPGGVVREYVFDALSGALLKTERED